jgi:hypothetical protein
MPIVREMYNNIVEGLQQVGNNCRDIEELSLNAQCMQRASKNLPSFPYLRRLTFRNILLLPPINMMDWTNLTYVEGAIWKYPLARAISALPNLKEIICESSLVFHQDVIDICNLCREKCVCSTLKVLDFSTGPNPNNKWYGGRINDDSLYLLLDTFPNLTAISIDQGDLTLATADIAQKVSRLSQLRILRFKDTRIFSSLANSVSYDSINGWLVCFPKSLEIVSYLNCRISGTDNLDKLSSSIVSRFNDILPNLGEIEITFKYGHSNPFHYLTNVA